LAASVYLLSEARLHMHKSTLQSIIKEETIRSLNESWGEEVETGSSLLEFARAYAGLGDAVIQQVDQIVSAWNTAGPEHEMFADAVYDCNPNAIDLAIERLGHKLSRIQGCDEAEDILAALQKAQEMFSHSESGMEDTDEGPSDEEETELE